MAFFFFPGRSVCASALPSSLPIASVRSVLAVLRLFTVASCAALAVLAAASFPSKAFFFSGVALVYTSSFCLALASLITLSSAALAALRRAAFIAFSSWALVISPSSFSLSSLDKG